ncbi:MAG: hypothetical protein AUG16_05620 [Thaumarchaeota archaeon 13_1_20CM_2_39_20]|nr:MAG: hypothetical protein AUI59_00345 [Thaumarchaeota archaeon 13_1_40CM_2_39_13_1]OLE40088.1 MAG: hypothetical protein AUG16_05620 [Thaumarchaeota archaeon 13_1_20CM_2_39_20]
MQPMKKIGKLGALLIHLPPNFKEDSEKSQESFLQILPSDFKFAIEFLDKSYSVYFSSHYDKNAGENSLKWPQITENLNTQLSLLNQFTMINDLDSYM